MRRHLILVSESYPYSGASETTFIDPEIEYLVGGFADVTLVPERIYGKGNVPGGVILEKSLAAALARNRVVMVLRGALTWEFLSEILDFPAVCTSWNALLRTAMFIARARVASAWIEKFLARRALNPEETVVYCFWFYHSAHGFALFKKKVPALRVVARAHGADLYEERHHPHYIPCRKSSLQLIDAVYPDSEVGLAYLERKWPDAASDFQLGRLGTIDPGYQARMSQDGILRIVSCSSITPVKRVELLVGGIAELSRQHANLRIEWNHFGSGPLYEAIRETATLTLPASVSWRFHGQVPSSTVMAWYRDEAVDVFVNVSASEGTPVSIMEAASCGIPVVATAVGGNCEIVSERNGTLLPAMPQASDIASALRIFAFDPAIAVEKRSGSRQVWVENYFAGRNFPDFVRRLQDPRMQADAMTKKGE
jgi:glycosyltransferase involved in cell wall biosynthesis